MHMFTKYFQIPDHRQRTPGNRSESRRFRAFRPEFQRITRNSPTWPAIRKWIQRTSGNYSESREFRTIRTKSRQITRNSRYLHTYSKSYVHLYYIMHLVMAHNMNVRTCTLHKPRLVLHNYLLYQQLYFKLHFMYPMYCFTWMYMLSGPIVLTNPKCTKTKKLTKLKVHRHFSAHCQPLEPSSNVLILAKWPIRLGTLVDVNIFHFQHLRDHLLFWSSY